MNGIDSDASQVHDEQEVDVMNSGKATTFRSLTRRVAWHSRRARVRVGIAALLTMAILLTSGCTRDAYEADAFDEATLSGFAATVDALREGLLIPAVSVAIVHDQDLLWSEGFGVADVENGVPATADTPYGLASVTKPFAAFLLMRQVEAGSLDLDTPIAEFGLALGDDRITVRHLLTHTSEGIPGVAYAYNGGRYAQLTTVIEQLYGDSFRNVLRQEILAPLQMTDSALNCGTCGVEYFLSTLSEDDPERAFEHVYRDSAVPYQYDADYEVYAVSLPDYANAAAGLISTVEDLARFAIAIERDVLVSAATKEVMFTPTQLASGASPYGLGWFTETIDGLQLIWHYGYGAYSSLFLMVPDLQLTLIVLANTQNLSRPFPLGIDGVSVLTSPFAWAFYKTFVLDLRLEEPVPSIDWTADADELVAQLSRVTDADMARYVNQELWTMRMLCAGVGRYELASQLLAAHNEVFPQWRATPNDLYQVGRPSARPDDDIVALTDEETVRWIGPYRIDPAYAASGLPMTIEIRSLGHRLLAIDAGGGCQQLLPQSPTRAVTSSNPDLMLVAIDADGAFDRIELEHAGATVGAYDRAASPAREGD